MKLEKRSWNEGKAKFPKYPRIAFDGMTKFRCDILCFLFQCAHVNYMCLVFPKLMPDWVAPLFDPY